DEQVYLYDRIQENRAKICDAFAILAILFDAILFFVQASFQENTALWWICRYSALQAAVWTGILISNDNPKRKQLFMGIGNVMVQIIGAWIILDLFQNSNQTLPIDRSFIIAYTIVIVASVITMCWISIPLLYASIMFSCTFSLILPQVIQGAANGYIACLLILFMPTINLLLQSRTMASEIREMQVKLANMSRGMALSNSKQKTEPKSRFSICISSDWRDEDYYQRVQNILKNQLDNIDYYMDWIADELFVVIYLDEHQTIDILKRQNLMTSAISACQKILHEKSNFASDHEIDLAIDIGLSSGKCLIGVIGPSNHKKATALGSNPGRSRRMQGAGKLIRSFEGTKDRIIFGDDVVSLLSTQARKELKISDFSTENRKLRNLVDKTIFYIELEEQLNLALKKVA
ncbi:MAG: hypothetical protein NT027_03370, partial [Proteobacteria bacterium]|nr:hypothetical protein [Pseudomonadota bacterium]